MRWKDFFQEPIVYNSEVTDPFLFAMTMTTKIPQLRPVQQRIFIELAKKEGGDPQALLDSLIDHFRAGPNYEEYCRRIECAERSLDEGAGIPHAQVMKELKDRLSLCIG